MKNRKLNIPFGLKEIYAIWTVQFKRRKFLILWTIIFISEIYTSSLFMYLIIREVIKHDVYGKQHWNGKREKWNFCRLSSALCTVDSKYLYLLWIVRDTSIFVWFI